MQLGNRHIRCRCTRCKNRSHSTIFGVFRPFDLEKQPGQAEPENISVSEFHRIFSSYLSAVDGRTITAACVLGEDSSFPFEQQAMRTRNAAIAINNDVVAFTATYLARETWNSQLFVENNFDENGMCRSIWHIFCLPLRFRPTGCQQN